MRGEDRATEEAGGGADLHHGPSDRERPGVVTLLAEERRQRRPTPPPLPSRRSPPPVPPPVMQSPPADLEGSGGGRHFSIPVAAPPIAGLPAEAPSAVERFHPSSLRRQWWWERWRETPCWLTSMVVHLAVMLVIGSIAVPPARVTGFNSWMLAFADEHDPLAEADLVIVQMDEAQQEGGEAGEHQNPPPRVEEEVAFHAPAPVEPPAVQPPATVIEETPEDVEEHFPPAEAETPEALEEPPAPILLASAAALREHEPQPAAEMPAFGGGPPGMLEENPVYDYVVDRFIKYDIGELRGAAGQQAKRDFQALGPYAVPALVRGLNRSASIQASCPVVVIASKLEKSLSSAGDYQMIRYAVENIGREVPENAPHLARLKSLREALLRQHLERPERLRRELASQGLPASNETVHAVTRYSEAPHETLTTGVHSADPEERLAAVAAASRLTRAITDGQRSHLAAQLILRLGDHDPMIRSQADAGLAALLEVDPRRSAEWVRVAAAGDPRWFWRDRLAEFDRAKQIERGARTLLLQGMTYERNGRRDAAQERYRQLLEEYPGADAARDAALRLAAGG